MPTYEYACGKCGKTYERLQPMSAKSVGRCPACGGKARRLISRGGGFLFKGSGFYITDYRSKDYSDKAKAESPGGSKPSGEGCGKATGTPCGKPACAAAGTTVHAATASDTQKK